MRAGGRGPDNSKTLNKEACSLLIEFIATTLTLKFSVKFPIKLAIISNQGKTYEVE